ncbi:hypothetical protein [Chroococcus sp. FPU101]|uniref:hypothetical protein n=1 Tax=Chroococcus sp. FPU101 TaxID=1974212 RepID=UPI001A8C6D8E|nr:hypothetical protein [Chroococcus sp. FPU101]GFE69063.1 hypothetical protein CFPU101_16730 [Chroococcus sp. FPU101]
MKRYRKSLLDDAIFIFQTLITDVLEVGLGWVMMLVLTKGKPSEAIIILSFVIGTIYVAWRNVRRMESR